MAGVRPFTPEDIPRVGKLYGRVLAQGAPIGESAWPYYRTIFFDNPWVDDELPSLVFENTDGEIVGFIGLVPRRMVLAGEPIRVAVTTQFMVDPAWRRKLVGVRLLTTLLRGPQDLTVADRAGEEGRQVWEGTGGHVSLLHSLYWTRPLRPLTYARSLIRKRPVLGPVATMLGPVCRLGDAAAARLPQSHFCQATPSLAGESVDCATMAAHVADYPFTQALRPDYDRESLTWLLKLMAEDPRHGGMQRVLVRDADGSTVGWYIYHLKAGGIGEVVHLWAGADRVREVLDHLFHHAWQEGAVAMRGRLEPSHCQELSDRYCLIRRDGPWVLIHSGRDDVIRAFCHGDVVFTRLDAEWWINFPEGQTGEADSQASPPTPVVVKEPVSRWRTEVISTRAGLEKLADEWNTLLKESAAGTLFLSWEWVNTWLSAVHPEASLFVPVVRDRDGRLAAVAPFYLSELRLLKLLKYRCLRILGDVGSGAEYPDLLIRADLEEELLPVLRRLMLEHRDRWDCLWLRDVAEWSGAFDRLRRLFDSSEFYFNHRPRAYGLVTLPETGDAYFSALSANARSTVQRHVKRIRAAGDCEFVRCETPEELPELLSALFDLHTLRWRSINESGTFKADPRVVNFYRSFAPVALANGWLRLYALKTGVRIQAIQLGYASNGVFYQIQEGFDPDAAPGIGNALRKFVIDDCIEQGLRVYDFLSGFTDHKRRWGAKQRDAHDVFVGRRSLKTSLLFARRIWPTGRYMRQESPSTMPDPVLA